MEQEEGRAERLANEGRVYVLRVWREREDHPPAWHATVREGTHGVRRSFASVDDCIEHLYGELLKP
ncbi:hypothetical protein DAETH_40010 (plasmid) [Deinococcus aetherius]|uniref:Uncharacterized protein n=1 Tax=Deinococcus aetherius TaxID=200252 RepID=A0ABN6RQW5_9DEIO|nr:hypothetical protein [Deinococcus aetherius]BDP44032.1 hypothetical protein DAETH_40010 [Deinococcus aetherius]